MKPLLILIAPLFVVSCAAPKAVVIEDEPTPPPTTIAQAPEPPAEPPKPTSPTDGLRLPDMLTLPGEKQFRPSTSPTADPARPVISRPPVE